MTPKQRVLERLKGNHVDRIPNFNILMMFAARYIGRPMSEFCTDYRILVKGNLKCAEAFGIDILSTLSDPYRETADFGAPIRFPYDSLPICKPCITSAADIKKLKAFKVEDSVRMLDRVRAIELYKREAGDEYPILGWLEGCAAESADLMGLTRYFMAFYDEPEMIRELMDICFEAAVNCIKPQIDAGADIIGIGDAVASVAGPELYRKWVLPYEKKLFAEIRSRGAIGRLHICGNITGLLDDIRDCGADIVDVDWMVDFAAAREKLSPMSVCGNFNPVAVVRDESPDIIAQAVNKCADEGGKNCIIMAGCEIPPDTPHANLLAVHRALVERGRYN